MERNTIAIGIVVSYKGKGDFDQERSYWRLLTGKEGNNVLFVNDYDCTVSILHVVRLFIYILCHYAGFLFLHKKLCNN